MTMEMNSRRQTGEKKSVYDNLLSWCKCDDAFQEVLLNLKPTSGAEKLPKNDSHVKMPNLE